MDADELEWTWTPQKKGGCDLANILCLENRRINIQIGLPFKLFFILWMLGMREGGEKAETIPYFPQQKGVKLILHGITSAGIFITA
jgi:hypothetical protein